MKRKNSKLPAETVRDLIALRNKGKQFECIKKIERLRRSYRAPTSRYLMRHLEGDCFLDMGEWERAKGVYSEILRDEEDKIARANRGFALSRLGQFEAAFEDFKVANRLDPNNPVILRQLAETRYQLRKINSAIWYLQRLVRVAPREPIGHVLLGDCLMDAGRWVAAYRAYAKALTLEPANKRAVEQMRRIEEHILRED